ncbi:MAG: ornithine carbamoyltransferase, partial [Holdemanella sp.]|nr:ornithine carbamoyltransferase [Holdemanella sp.]
MKHLLKLMDLTKEDITSILDIADQLKYELKHGIPHKLLDGKSVALILEKVSTRTRVAFETGINQLGGQPLLLSKSDLQMDRGEPIQDTARALSRYLDGVMIRTFDQSVVDNFAKYG